VWQSCAYNAELGIIGTALPHTYLSKV